MKTKAIKLPYRIIVDTAEQHAYTFDGLCSDADQQNRPLEIETVRRSLGRHPNGFGDYSIEGHEGQFGFGVGIERKSMEDLHSTLLGFGDGHRERFEQELSNLSQCTAALVVVECDYAEMILSAPTHGKRSPEENQRTNAKQLARSVLAMMQDFRVPWLFAGSRRMAEVATFRFLDRYWRNNG